MAISEEHLESSLKVRECEVKIQNLETDVKEIRTDLKKYLDDQSKRSDKWWEITIIAIVTLVASALGAILSKILP